MTKLKTMTLALAALAAMTMTSQADTVSVKGAINQWEDLDTECRGNFNPKFYEPACKRRAQLSAWLEKKGWCNGKKDQSGPEMEWHKCTAQSLGGAQ
jgi:hypothetical protein